MQIIYSTSTLRARFGCEFWAAYQRPPAMAAVFPRDQGGKLWPGQAGGGDNWNVLPTAGGNFQVLPTHICSPSAHQVKGPDAEITSNHNQQRVWSCPDGAQSHHHHIVWEQHALHSCTAICTDAVHLHCTSPGRQRHPAGPAATDCIKSLNAHILGSACRKLEHRMGLSRPRRVHATLPENAVRQKPSAWAAQLCCALLMHASTDDISQASCSSHDGSAPTQLGRPLTCSDNEGIGASCSRRRSHFWKSPERPAANAAGSDGWPGRCTPPCRRPEYCGWATGQGLNRMFSGS